MVDMMTQRLTRWLLQATTHSTIQRMWRYLWHNEYSHHSLG